jgi:hypothetical protein
MAGTISSASPTGVVLELANIENDEIPMALNVSDIWCRNSAPAQAA